MGSQEVLTGLFIAASLAATPEALQPPSRLTVGTADQLLGQLTPDGKTLYFVSNVQATSLIFVQDANEGRPKQLFDEGADVTWPRVSPNGQRLLYVSYRDDAAGQLCVRDLPSGDGRRCLTDRTGAVQAEWIDDKRIALVSRGSLQSDLELIEVSVGHSLAGKALIEKNLTSPTFSPDRKWLVYVPVERERKDIGPGFAAHTAHGLEAVRLDAPAPPRTIDVPLPGVSAQPAFSADGRALFFTQFLEDTNHDGVVDASDHGVLFRIPFEGTEEPEQLTDASWNCQYPAPTPKRLVSTCTRDANLDVYELPLHGEVPPEWDAERLQTEIDLSTRPAEQLLLYRHLSRRDPDGRGHTWVRLLRLHLSLDEFDAAAFYADRLTGTDTGLARVLLTLIDCRRAVRARDSGQTVEPLHDEASQWLAALKPEPGDSPGARALAAVVRSEVYDAKGDPGAAKRELQATPLDEETPRLVLELYHERADRLYRELDDREALAAACRRLAQLESLPPAARLTYASAWVRVLGRGVPFAEQEPMLARERKTVPEDSELAFALDLGSALLDIREDATSRHRDRVIALYKRQTRSDRRRMIMSAALGRAADLGANTVVETLVQDYVDNVPRGTSERKRAERLYAQVITGRAFRRRYAGQWEEAKADFDAVVHHTGSLEALAGGMDMRLKEREAPEAILAEVTRLNDPPRHLTAFARSYLLARQFGTLTGKAHDKAAYDAIAHLREDWEYLKGQRIAQALYGAVRHEKYLTTRDVAEAERANRHYLIALEMAQKEPRLAALLLGQLGLLHTQVGNFRIALSYLEQREAYPYFDNGAGLAVRMARARALLHVGRDKDAAKTADEALEMASEGAKLREYRPLALDRAALYNLAAGKFERALTLYQEVLAATPPNGRNALVLRLAHAAAALGAQKPELALADLGPVNAALTDGHLGPELQWPHATEAQVLRTYRLIAAGLEANAYERLGKATDASRALEKRRAVFAEKLKDQDRDDDLRAMAFVENRLSAHASELGDVAGATRWAQQALGDADLLGKRTGTPVSAEGVDALWLTAELAAFRGATVPFDLEAKLSATLDQLATDPVWRGDARWLEIYLGLGASAK